MQKLYLITKHIAIYVKNYSSRKISKNIFCLIHFEMHRLSPFIVVHSQIPKSLVLRCIEKSSPCFNRKRKCTIKTNPVYTLNVADFSHFPALKTHLSVFSHRKRWKFVNCIHTKEENIYRILIIFIKLITWKNYF